MIEGVFIVTACLIKDPSHCKTWKAKEPGADIHKCMMDTPQLVYQWTTKYGKEWKIQSYKCSTVDEEAV